MLPPGRQWSHDKDVISAHREDQSDSFTDVEKVRHLSRRAARVSDKPSQMQTRDPSPSSASALSEQQSETATDKSEELKQ